MITFDTKALDKGLQNIAIAVIKAIRDNTKKGVDMNGSKFKPYSAAYREWKVDWMRNGKKANNAKSRVSSNPTVNLMLRGVMLNSISKSRIKDGFDVYIADKNRALIGFAHHTGTGQPKREFFGVSPAKEKELYLQYLGKLPLLRKS